jgi:hypothetical protein
VYRVPEHENFSMMLTPAAPNVRRQLCEVQRPSQPSLIKKMLAQHAPLRVRSNQLLTLHAFFTLFLFLTLLSIAVTPAFRLRDNCYLVEIENLH